jgi:hypothetical protein
MASRVEVAENKTRIKLLNSYSAERSELIGLFIDKKVYILMGKLLEIKTGFYLPSP